MVATELCYMILTGEELYKYLVDYNNDDPFYMFPILKERLRFFSGRDLVSNHNNSEEHYYYCAFNNEKIVAILKLKTGGFDSMWHKGWCNWLCYCSVDTDYKGQGISKILVEMMFKFAKEKNINILGSGYTKEGFDRLKPVLARYAKKYGVDFLDDREKPEYD
jgi:GNAT superfamily N-acetyltransferase